MRLSVVVATYNGERFLEEQLRSIVGQTRSPDEVIVTDDGSTDRTVEIAEAVLAGARPMILVGRQGGVVPNIERGLAHATGDVIALADQDDVWRPDKLDLLTGVLGRRPELQLVHSDARLVTADGSDLGERLLDSVSVGSGMRREIHRGDAFDVLLRRNVVTGATVMLRRELIERALPVPDGWLHDEWLAMVAAATGRLDLVEEPLIDYRQHEGNVVGARELRLGGKVGRVLEPRSERNARLLRRAEALVERLPAMPDVSEERIRLVEAKLGHEQRRSALADSRLRRIPGVVRGIARDDYRRFGRGAADAIRDLVQPV